MVESNTDVAFRLVERISKILAYRLRRIEQFDAVEQGRREMRSELAADLHDRTMSDLSGILMNLGLLKFSLSPSPSNESTVAGLEEIVSMVKQTDKTLRNLVREKGHDDVLMYGLDGSVNELLSGLSKEPQPHKINMRYKVMNLQGENIPGQISEDIFQIVRQSIINSVDHSKCSNIEISLSWKTEGIAFSVTDDGIGFLSDKISNVPETGHFGLLNLKLRAERIGGTLDIQTGSGEGTKVSGFVPITRKTQKDSEGIVRNYSIDSD
jgi:signal transduction histidine kinase